MCPLDRGRLWEDVFRGRMAPLTKQLASHSGSATALRSPGGRACSMHIPGLRSAPLKGPWGDWRGPCTVNTGAPMLGTPVFTMGLPGTVCWLGRP